MDRRPDRSPSRIEAISTRPRAGWILRAGSACLLALGLVSPATPSLAGSHDDHGRGHGHGHRTHSPRSGPARGVPAPNVRFEIFYDYLEQDSTDTYNGAGPSTLSIDEHDGHGSRSALTGVFPVWGPIGARAQLRGAYGHRQRSLDGLARGNNEISASGAGLELFVRNPERGALSAGGGWDRLARDGPIDAEEYRGHVTAQVFFPDLGLGPVDWNLHFGFTHREVDDVPGTADVDADRYLVRAQSGWYASENVQILLGVQWDRAEEEFSSEEDTEAIFEARWFVPVPVIPVELRVGGSAGVSEYKRPPFRADRRPVYGASVGLVFRYGAGETLLDTQRRYD